MAKRKQVETFKEPNGKEVKKEDVVSWYEKYRENFSREKAYEWAKKYAKENNLPSNFNYIPDNIGWLCRLIELGYEPTSEQKERIEIALIDNQTSNNSNETEESPKKEKPKKSPQQLLDQKLSYIYGDIDEYMDCLFDVVDEKELNNLDIYSKLRQNNESAMACTKIINYIQDVYLNDLELYFENDTDTLEAYSDFTKTNIKNIYKTILKIVDEVEKWKSVKQKDRKPKKVKTQTKAKRVKKVKYREYDDELGIKSDFPENVIGAKEVWLYDTKTRRLKVLKNSTGNLNIKGTTVIDYEEESSYKCTLRKPSEQVPVISKSKKSEVNKFEKTLKKNVKNLNGRLNDNIIILRVF